MSTYEFAVEETFEPTAEEILDIESLVKAKLLPLPGSATRVLGLIEDVNVTTHDLAEVIAYDPVLASRVMRLANSPMYAMQKEVATVQAAVAAVGVRSIYDIVMLGVAADSFSSDMRSMKTGVSIWEHSVATAIAARALSKELSLRGTEEAFTCGLLHDIGKNLLFQTDPMRYTETEVAEVEEAASKLEEQIFGFNHSQVGFYVARRWGLGDAVAATILWHHKPKLATRALAITHIVNVADDLVTMKGMGLHMETPDSLPASDSVAALELDSIKMENAWAATEASLNEFLESC